MTFGIIGDLQLSLEEQNNIQTNSLEIKLLEEYETPELNLELSIFASAIWKLVNLVWSLFVGGLIYGKIKWN